MNKVIIVGNIGQDPETKYSQQGTAITNLSVATSERWKDKNSNEMQEHTEWHRVVMFGRKAEVCQEFLKKGSKVLIEGKLRTRKWQDKDGVDRWTTEIHGLEMEMLGSRNESHAPTQQKSFDTSQQKPFEPPEDDDIPF